jgi:hypothetical protein
MHVTVGVRNGLAILKLERQEGAEIKFSGEEGKRVFDFDVLENLILNGQNAAVQECAFCPNGYERR